MNELPLELPPPGGSFLLDASAAARALLLASPMLDALLRNERVNGTGVLWVVVMNPAISPSEAPFEQAVLYEHGFGKPREQWDVDHAAAARAKARLSWSYGVDTHRLQTLTPQRLRAGDTAQWGSVVVDGIVVAVSGCDHVYDEAAAGIVAMLLRAEVKAAAAELGDRTVLKA